MLGDRDMNAHGRRYSQKMKEAALRKWEGGKTPKEIAKEMGIGLQTLYRWYHRKMAESGHDESGRIVTGGQVTGNSPQVTAEKPTAKPPLTTEDTEERQR